MRKLTQEEVIARFREVHGDRYDYSKVVYKEANKKVCIICLEHGAFFQAPKHHLSGHGCSKCATSRGEYKVEEYLKQNKIEYQSQYNVKLEKQLFSRNNLKVDFICRNIILL